MNGFSFGSIARAILAAVPLGGYLPAETWARHHRLLSRLTWCHGAAIAMLGPRNQSRDHRAPTGKAGHGGHDGGANTSRRSTPISAWLTAMTGVYSLVKVLHAQQRQQRFLVLANNFGDADEGRRLFDTLSRTALSFLLKAGKAAQ